jgi:hypothetical protein
MDLAAARGVALEELAYALLAEATLQSLQRLADLPAGTSAEVVDDSQTCMQNNSRSIEGAGLDHLDLTETYVVAWTRSASCSSASGGLVCSNATAERLLKLGAPDDLEVIEEENVPRQGWRGDAR